MPNRKQPICTHCHVRQPESKKQSLRLAKSARSFLGFYKFKCVACEKKFLYPMSWPYLAIYIVALLVFIGTAIPSLAQGEPPACFVLGLAGLYGIVKNVRVSRAVKEAEANAVSQTEKLADVFS